MAPKRRVFVLGGYQPFAACYLIYHVGRVLEEQFNYEPVMVRLGNETPENSPFFYQRRYATIDLSELSSTASPADLFLPIAAAWDLSFGLNLNCRKLLYVQGANTFKVLDGFMDGYVSVSTFVQETLRHFYEIESPVIHPFIDFDQMPQPQAWRDRPEGGVLVFAKPPPIVDALVRAFIGRLSSKHPGIKPTFRVIQRGVPHAELIALMASTRYVLSLSPTEGFGLMPLEAMACGCAVVGFHAGGGRDYMNDQNSRTAGYPRLDMVVDHFADIYRNDALAEQLATQGRADARSYTRNHFDSQWVRYLKIFGA